MPKLVFKTQAEANHFFRLLMDAGYSPTVHWTARNVTVTSAAPRKQWREILLKFNKQQVIQAAANGNIEQKLML